MNNMNNMGDNIKYYSDEYPAKNNEQLVEFSLGELFPIDIPMAEGMYMDIVESGIVLIMQMPDTTEDELDAFAKGIIEYSYVGIISQPMLSMWMIVFPSAIGMVEVHYDASIEDKEIIEKYMEIVNGEVKNTMVLYLLDGKQIRGIKFMELDALVVKGFHEVLSEQLKFEYSNKPCHDNHEIMRNYTLDEIFEMGIQATVKRSISSRLH